jgi:hypothetical protein
MEGASPDVSTAFKVRSSSGLDAIFPVGGKDKVVPVLSFNEHHAMKA